MRREFSRYCAAAHIQAQQTVAHSEMSGRSETACELTHWIRQTIAPATHGIQPAFLVARNHRLQLSCIQKTDIFFPVGLRTAKSCRVKTATASAINSILGNHFVAQSASKSQPSAPANSRRKRMGAGITSLP